MDKLRTEINKREGSDKNMALFKNINDKLQDKSFIDSRKEINYKIPSYEKMVEEMTNLIRSNKVLYSQYNVS